MSAAEWTSVGASSRASCAGIERHLVASRGKMLGREEGKEGRQVGRKITFQVEAFVFQT